MNEEMVHVPKETVMLGTLEVAPEKVVERASKIATELAKVILDRKLFSQISGKRYVRVEGWNTLGALLGVLPREREVKEVEGGYEAYVDLVRVTDGVVIGGASAICTSDEGNWSDRDAYAVRSMAITRATGKAFRLGFSWIMKLAGYEVTPAEEIVEANFRTVDEQPPVPEEEEMPPLEMYTPQGWREGHFKAAVEELIKNDVIPSGNHPIHYANFIKLSGFGTDVDYNELIDWGRLYRGYRDSGLASKEAAKKASEDYGRGR